MQIDNFYCSFQCQFKSKYVKRHTPQKNNALLLFFLTHWRNWYCCPSKSVDAYGRSSSDENRRAFPPPKIWSLVNFSACSSLICVGESFLYFKKKIQRPKTQVLIVMIDFVYKRAKSCFLKRDCFNNNPISLHLNHMEAWLSDSGQVYIFRTCWGDFNKILSVQTNFFPLCIRVEVKILKLSSPRFNKELTVFLTPLDNWQLHY